MESKTLIPVLMTILLVSFNFSCRKTFDSDMEKSASIATEALTFQVLTSAKKFHAASTTPQIRKQVAESMKFRKPNEVLIPIWSKAVSYSKTANLPSKQTPLGSYSLLLVPAAEFKLDNKDVGFLRKFIFVEKGGIVKQARIVEIYGDPHYLSQHGDDLFLSYNSQTIENFSGSIITYDLTYRFLRGLVFKDGIKQNALAEIKSAKKNSMITPDGAAKASLLGFSFAVATTMTLQCYDRYEVITYSNGSQEWVFLYTWCEDTGGGSSSGGGSPGGGGDGSPVSPGSFGFPANPYDGLVHTYYYPSGKSVVFTYDSSMGAWLLPEIQILKDQGNTVSGPTNMGDKIVSAIAIATAEPTAIGEIVVVGYITYLLAVYTYNNIAKYYEEREKNHQYCVNLYLKCTTITPYRPCDDCLNYCEVQGDWWYSNCPGIY